MRSVKYDTHVLKICEEMALLAEPLSYRTELIINEKAELNHRQPFLCKFAVT